MKFFIKEEKKKDGYSCIKKLKILRGRRKKLQKKKKLTLNKNKEEATLP